MHTGVLRGTGWLLPGSRRVRPQPAGSSTHLRPLGRRLSASGRKRGDCVISGSRSTCKEAQTHGSAIQMGARGAALHHVCSIWRGHGAGVSTPATTRQCCKHCHSPKSCTCQTGTGMHASGRPITRYNHAKQARLAKPHSSSQICAPTLRLGVNGSGRRMLRGKAERMRLRIWMQLGGTTSQSWK